MAVYWLHFFYTTWLIFGFWIFFHVSVFQTLWWLRVYTCGQNRRAKVRIFFKFNYLNFKQMITVIILSRDVLYGWCTKCRISHKRMYKRIEGWVVSYSWVFTWKWGKRYCHGNLWWSFHIHKLVCSPYNLEILFTSMFLK